MENIEAMLCAYIEGDLDTAGRAQIEKHLQDNPQHRKLIQELIAMRDLVRGLPRVKAPLDVGESLRGKVERSILLDDSPETGRERVGGSRWPQIFAVAAIFLLCASLCLILYRALGPTLRPPVFTENVPPKLSPTATSPIDSLARPSIPTKQETAAALGERLEDRKAAAASPPVVAPSFAIEQHPSLVSQAQQQIVTLAQLNNVEAIRRRLQNSGYDIGIDMAHTALPVLMVVNSTDPPATNAQVTQFLSNSNGISWKRVPADAQVNSIPTTLPSVTSDQQELSAIVPRKAGEISASAIPTTQPASDVYIATGFTPQQADALRQSLAVQQNLAKVQVSLQSAAVLATTQPSAQTQEKDQSGAFRLRVGVASPPATKPSEAANSSADLAIPTTSPSNSSPGQLSQAMLMDKNSSVLANSAVEVNNSSASSDGSKNLQPVDAVIVIQATAANAPAPAISITPATRPSPSTQP